MNTTKLRDLRGHLQLKKSETKGTIAIIEVDSNKQSAKWSLHDGLKVLLKYPSSQQLKSLIGSGFTSPYYNNHPEIQRVNSMN